MGRGDEDEQTAAGPRPSLEDENAGLHPLFWDALPEDADQNPIYAGLKAVEEEASPEERALSLKDQANNKLKIGLKANNKVLLREAIVFYTRGIEANCTDDKLNSVLYSNRAHVESLLENWKRALSDAQQASKLDPVNTKAYFRAARAALKLSDYTLCQNICWEGLAVEPGAKELQDLVQDATKLQIKAAEVEARLQRERDLAMEPAKRVGAAISAAGYQVTRPQMHLGNRQPTVDKAGHLHWPVLFLYPEVMQTDAVEDMPVGDKLADHLDVMFAPDAPPLDWDSQTQYTRESVELYYLSNAGTPLSQENLVEALHGQWPEDFIDHGPQRYGDRASHWVRISEDSTLHDVLLRPDYIIPGIPVMFVVAAGTEYRQRFLSEQIQR